MWAIGGMILTAETDVLGEIKLSQLHLVYYKSPTLTCLVLNPHLCSDRPATNLLSQGMARQFAEKLAVDRSKVQYKEMTLSEKHGNREQITKRENQEQTSCSGGPGYGP